MSDHRADVTRDPASGLLPFCPLCGSYSQCFTYCSAKGRYHLAATGQAALDFGGAA